MAWVKLDDGFADHPKILNAGAEAVCLWICGLAYCNRQPGRDGFIPAAKVPVLYPMTGAAKAAARLVAVRLWEPVDGGFLVHDYHDYQPTALAAADLSEKRAVAGRSGGKRSGEVRANAKQVASALLEAPKQLASRVEANAEAKTNPVPDPDPSASTKHTTRACEPACAEEPADPWDPEPQEPLEHAAIDAIRYESGGNPLVAAARGVYDLAQERSGGKLPPWSSWRERTTAALLYVYRETKDPGSPWHGRDAVADVGALAGWWVRDGHDWGQAGSKLTSAAALFGAPGKTAERVGGLLAKVLSGPKPKAKIKPAEKAPADWKTDDILIDRPTWEHEELLRREPDITTWPDYWIRCVHPDQRIEWDRRQAAKQARKGLRAVPA